MNHYRNILTLIGLGILSVRSILQAEVMDVLENPILEINRVHNAIKIDGNLTELEWGKAKGTDYFLEIEPGENIIPAEKTEVKVTYDDQNLYVAFWAYAHPEDIRASYQNRDRAWMDDFVAIFLDTYGDANAGTMIGSNPYGIQMDALNNGNGNDDPSFDLVYKSQGKITDEGYQVEMAIPFSSLSFPDKEVQEWKVGFYRSLPREKRSQIVWGGFDRTDPCFLCQMGTLKGIQGIKQRGNIEFLPAIVGSQISELDQNNILQKGTALGQASLGVKYSLSSDQVAEFTINPDYSQVEADEEQVDVNTTFALFFPEKRPFFNAGNDLVDTWINAIYTRSINNPIASGRIINRGQQNSWYMLSAMDEDSPYIIPGEEQSFSLLGGRSISNIFRFRRTLEEASHFGILATDRRMVNNDGSGSVVGFDTRYKFNKTYQMEFQTLFSKTQEPSDSLLDDNSTFGDNNTFTFDGESFVGNAVEIEFSRDTEHWGLETGYDHKTSAFRAENGFISNNNNRRIYLESYWVYTPDKMISKVMGGFHSGIESNFDGQIKTRYTSFFGNVMLPRQTRLAANITAIPYNYFKNKELTGLWKIRLRINSNYNKIISFGGSLGKSLEKVTSLDIPEKGSSNSFSLWTRLKVSDRMQVGGTYENYRMTTLDKKEEYYSGYLTGIRMNYQYNRALSFRLLGQYNDFSRTFQLQPLVSYQPSPFTIFYIGSTSNQIADNLSIDSIKESQINDRQLFLKFQYLFN
ncbi:MAG: carbohydrate binding family 9 domain-containing protein [Candidatus Marinimicrobia bacterium]|nr:carbohydrate binding family 9 domain-containing protein [Candidatus Neomarinimicrobiota bacterium]